MKVKNKKRKRLLKIGIWILLLPMLLFSSAILIIYLKQDAIVQSQINTMNKEHIGLIKIGDTHLAPFENFPNISLKIDDVQIFETKDENKTAILDVKDIYVRLNLLHILQGNFDIQSILVEEGFFNIVLHKDGSINLENALATTEDTESKNPLNIHLKSITLKNLDIHKLDEATNVDIETFIYDAQGGFKTEKGLINAHIDTEFELNIFDNGDTTYIHNKHFEFHTDVTIDEKTGMVVFKPSGITMEHGDFQMEGSLDTKNEMTIDLEIKGTKPNFDMFIAFAPTDIIPVLERYQNSGKIYLNATVKGPTLHGQMPFFNVNFGANEAFLENIKIKRKIDHMGFEGNFTNGEEHNLKTMTFSLKNMTANLEKGKFLGSFSVRNFEEPDIDMELDANFNLNFLANFLNLNKIKDASGTVNMKMKFHDIIDLENPEHTLQDLNQAYFAELKIDDLKLSSPDLSKPLEQLNMHLTMNGKKAEVHQLDIKLGQSDLSIKGFLSDLPAVVHHTNVPVTAHMDITSNILDISELTQYSEKDSSGIDERIEDFSVGFSFKSSGKNFTESAYLPKGEFFIDNLHAQLKHYPHELHDFHADILINDRDLRIVDFSGFIDDSDFHFDGDIHDYEFWMQPELNGDIDLDISLHSKLLRLEDVFSYQGENYVPKDYRHEEFDNLKLHAKSSMHYKNSELRSIDINLDKLTTKMHVHPMQFEDFRGRFHFENEHLTIKKFHGKMGRTVFNIDLNYYLGDSLNKQKEDNYLSLTANYIDADQLFNSKLESNKTPKETKSNTKTTNDNLKHVEAFNIYELPFSDIEFNVAIDHFIQNRIDIKEINGKLRTNRNHYLYIDTLTMNMAGGSIAMSGYFNGNDPKHIYMKPNLKLENVDVEKLLFKFENFGQDAIVSDNLKGKLSTQINGNIRVYPDLVPDLDQSEIHMDIEVLNGRLVNYEPMLLLSDYFGDKNLKNLKFDTLSNHLDITNGLITIPNMSLETTLGHFEFSGTQSLNDQIEYYLRIPWKVIKQGARNKLFGTKKTNKGETNDDEIIEIDPNKKTRYLNLKLFGTIDDYKIRLGKEKKRKKK